MSLNARFLNEEYQLILNNIDKNSPPNSNAEDSIEQIRQLKKDLKQEILELGRIQRIKESI